MTDLGDARYVLVRTGHKPPPYLSHATRLTLADAIHELRSWAKTTERYAIYELTPVTEETP